MKKLSVLVIVLAFFGITDFALAQGSQMPEKTLPDNYKIQPPATKMPPVPIDGVDVPHDVLVYAQLAYQGYAVTQAKETTWNGKKAYQLRIDNDSNPNDSNGMFLLYDTEWKLIAEEPYYAPLPDNRKIEMQPPPQEPEPQPIEEAPETSPNQEETTGQAPESEEIPEPEEPEEPDFDESPPENDDEDEISRPSSPTRPSRT